MTVLWGRTRSGKTRKAMECDSKFKWHATRGWFDGYEGEKRLVIDEFRDSQISISKLLEYLDGYVLWLPIKGSKTWARWTEVFITSNVNPEKWYTGVDPDSRDALFARFDSIIEMN